MSLSAFSAIVSSSVFSNRSDAVASAALAVAAEPLYTSVMVPVIDKSVSFSLELGINEFAFVEIGGDVSGNLAQLSEDQSFLNDSLMLDS